MIIYADLCFIMNFAADLILLKLVARDRRISRGRLAAGAAVGSLGAVVLMGSSRIWLRLLGSLVLAVLMLVIVFRGSGENKWLRRLGLLYGYAFLMGGFVQTLYQWILLGSNHARYGTIYAMALWILLITVCDWLLRVFFRRYGSMESRRQLMEVEIGFRGAGIRLMGLMDTGNSLKEPLTGYPVIVVTERPEWRVASWAEGSLETLYLIPYQTAGSGTACMLGFRPDYVQWKDGRTDAVIIAISQKEVLDPQQQYEAILSPQLINTDSRRRLSVCGKR